MFITGTQDLQSRASTRSGQDQGRSRYPLRARTGARLSAGASMASGPRLPTWSCVPQAGIW